MPIFGRGCSFAGPILPTWIIQSKNWHPLFKSKQNTRHLHFLFWLAQAWAGLRRLFCPLSSDHSLPLSLTAVHLSSHLPASTVDYSSLATGPLGESPFRRFFWMKCQPLSRLEMVGAVMVPTMPYSCSRSLRRDTEWWMGYEGVTDEGWCRFLCGCSGSFGMTHPFHFCNQIVMRSDYWWTITMTNCSSKWFLKGY